MLGSDHPKIHARHIEALARPFLCEYRYPADRPHGFPLTFPAETRREGMLAESIQGALAIARYHFRHGSDFRTLETPAP